MDYNFRNFRYDIGIINNYRISLNYDIHLMKIYVKSLDCKTIDDINKFGFGKSGCKRDSISDSDISRSGKSSRERDSISDSDISRSGKSSRERDSISDSDISRSNEYGKLIRHLYDVMYLRSISFLVVPGSDKLDHEDNPVFINGVKQFSKQMIVLKSDEKMQCRCCTFDRIEFECFDDDLTITLFTTTGKIDFTNTPKSTLMQEIEKCLHETAKCLYRTMTKFGPQEIPDLDTDVDVDIDFDPLS